MVTHLPAGDCAAFVGLLSSAKGLPVALASDKQAIAPGCAWLAPPDYHLMVETVEHFSLSVDAPVNFVRPSIDVLFESAAEVFGPQVIALTLSSSSSDGARGMSRVKARGGLTIAMAAASCEHRTLTEAVLARVDVDYCAELDEITALLQSVG
jgi:two-component system chemotaxis response regulator CheB